MDEEKPHDNIIMRGQRFDKRATGLNSDNDESEMVLMEDGIYGIMSSAEVTSDRGPILLPISNVFGESGAH